MDKSKVEAAFEADMEAYGYPVVRYSDGSFTANTRHRFEGWTMALARAGIAAPTGQQAEPVASLPGRVKSITPGMGIVEVHLDGGLVPEWCDPGYPVHIGTAPVNAEPAAPTDKIEEIRALLSEAHDFKSTSKAAQDNINAVLDLLDGIAAPTAAEEPSPLRNAIEAMARAEKLPLDRWPTNGAYKDSRTYIAFYGWKAGRASSTPAIPGTTRNDVLEEAALAAERVQDDYRERQSVKWPELRDDAETGAGECAGAIRAIKDASPSHPSEAKAGEDA